jgi:hypothetical protein
MPLLTNDSDQDWERFARTDPYFAVLTEPKYHGELSERERAEFFRSGEVHLTELLSIIRSRCIRRSRRRELLTSDAA